MGFTSVSCILISVYLLCAVAQFSDTPGKVFIAKSENDTTTLNLTFSINQAPGAFQIPVYVEVYNETVATSYVRVTCGLSPTGAGFSNANFSSTRITISNPSNGFFYGNISFGSPVAGRKSDLRCWCSEPDPFVKESTISDPKQFTIFPPGVVNFYSSTFTTGQPIQLKLSQIVRDNNVTVTCVGSGLTFAPILIQVGSQFAVITGYTVLPNVSSSVSIRCTAQSNNNGYQFLSSNSAGPSATVVKLVPSAALFPKETYLNRASMKASLSINQSPASEITFTCSVSTVYNWNDVTNITNQVGCSSVPGTTPSPGSSSVTVSPTSAPTANLTGLWQSVPSSFKFGAGELKTNLFREFELGRTAGVAEFTEELVVTRCCSADATFPTSAALMVAAVALTPPVSINWSDATAAENVSLETPIVDPAYKNFAPCPCNLTAGACDVNCCCDSDCTESDILVFDCLGGYFGGMDGGISRDFCGAMYYDTPDWFPIMCIHKETNGYLGHFYYPSGLIRNQTAFDAVMTSYAPGYSFRQNQQIFPGEPNANQVGYKEGLAVKTGLPTPASSFLSGPNYLLTLPQRNTWLAPVRFLINSDAFWVQNMSYSEKICGVSSPLSALTYVQSPMWGTSTGPLVLKDQGSTAVTLINVNYLCDSDGSKYVASGTTFKDALPPNEIRLFGLPSDDVEDCRFDDITGAFVCGNVSVGGTPGEDKLPPRCSWDNGYTAPPQPSLNSTNFCTNSVVRVFYNFTWSGQSILYLNATLILAPISLTTDMSDGSGKTKPALLSQRFKASFVSKPTDSPSGNSSRMQVLPVSGNPGYNVDLPVISGISVIGNATSDVLYLDTNSSSRLAFWKSGFGALCDGASRSSILFRQNVVGQCVLRLNFRSLTDCDRLRKQVLSGQDSLMPSDYISSVGNPHADNISDWVSIVRVDLSYLFSISSTDLYTTAATSTARSTETTNSYSNPPYYNYYSELLGSCSEIPSGINLHVMYAVAGKSNFQPIYRIVGAKIGYTLTTWRWNCAGTNSASCHASSTQVQSFVVSSTVTFTEVPPNPEPEVSRYVAMWYTPNHVCKGGYCWREIFYPFTKINEKDNQQQAIALGLAFIIFIIYFSILSFPVLREILKVFMD